MLRCAGQQVKRQLSSPPTRVRLSSSKAGPYKLVLIRHGESDWNRKNVFTGWVDCDLSEKGVAEAREGGQLMKQAGLTFDKAYTSVLRRAIKTCWLVLEEMDLMWLPTVKAWQLNERHYGALQGLNKAETVAKHGPEKVQVWRRSYDIPPPPVDESSEHYPGNDPRYKGLSKDQLPKTESLKITLERVLPYWNEHMTKEILAGKNLLVAAHGNSLRALVKQLDGVSDEAISELNIPTGTPLVYELDERLKPIPHPQAIAPLSGYYLGDQDAIRRRIEGVKAQTGGVKP